MVLIYLGLISVLKCFDSILNVFRPPHHSLPDHWRKNKQNTRSRRRINHFCLIFQAAGCQRNPTGIITLVCLVITAPLNVLLPWTLSPPFHVCLLQRIKMPRWWRETPTNSPVWRLTWFMTAGSCQSVKFGMKMNIGKNQQTPVKHYYCNTTICLAPRCKLRLFFVV